MELESQAAVSCPPWVLGTVAGPLGGQQGSSPLSHLSLQPLGCLLKEQNPQRSYSIISFSTGARV